MNQSGGSRTDTLVKLVLIFFISLLSFSVGTFVGKQFSDSQHKLAALETDFGHRDTASVAPDATDVKPEDALTDADIANLTEEFVKSEKQKQAVAQQDTQVNQQVAPDKMERKIKVIASKKSPNRTVAEADPEVMSQQEVAAANAEHAENMQKIQNVQQAANRIAAGETPTNTTQHHHQKLIAKQLPHQVASSTVGKYTVQVASYASQAEANKHAQSLRAKGFNAYTLPAKVKGKTWYRVSVGLYTTRNDAKSAREDLVKQSDLKAAIVQKIQE